MAASTAEPEVTDETEADEPEAAETVVDTVHGVVVETVRGQRVAHPTREELVELVANLRDDGYLMCLDVCGVDYLNHPGRDLPAGIDPQRFEVVVSLVSHRDRARLRLRVQVPDEDPVVPSLFGLHPGTEAAEREVFDMFGIRFDGHPDLTRILMPEDWSGNPLRKDYAVGQIPVQFKAPPAAR